MRKTWLATLLALGAFGVMGTAGAQASCAQTPSLEQAIAAAPLVFVGTVVSTADGDRVARVKVESIWKGPLMPGVVVIHGSPSSGSGVITSVDRMYRAGERYLFVLFSDQAPYQDNNCSATQPYTAQVAVLAPADARPPSPLTAADQIQLVFRQYWWPMGVAVLVIAVAAFFGARRLRSKRSL
jgi:hypothetical protein